MFSLPAPYAATPIERNAVRRDDIESRLLSAQRGLEAALAVVVEYREHAAVSLPGPDLGIGDVYGETQQIGRLIEEIHRLEGRATENLLEASLLVAGQEVTK